MAEVTTAGRRRFVIWLILAIIVIAFAAASVRRVLQTKQSDARLASMPIPVQTQPATVKSINEVIGASGTIQPSVTVTLTAKVIGKVQEVAVDVGSVVKPGDVLVTMDPRLYEANLAAARIAYDHARNQVAREQALAAKKFASPLDVENAEVTEASTYAQMVSAEIDLANTKIVSPAPAVILSRTANPGEMTRIDEQVLQLGILDPVLFDAAVSEDKTGSTYLGMEGDVRTDAFPGEIFSGKVQKMDSLVDPTTRTFGVYIRLENHDLRLKKDVTGYARLKSARDALVVPATAIVNPVGDRSSVFVIDGDGRARIREVRTGLSANNVTEILSGLQENEQVVVVGQYDLHDNDLVRANQNAPWNK